MKKILTALTFAFISISLIAQVSQTEKQALQNNAQKSGQTMSDYVKSKALKNNK